MPARVLELEWTAPLPALSGLSEGRLLALVRVHGQPAGLLRLEAPGGAVEPERLRQAVQRQLALPPPEQIPPPAPLPPPEPLSIVVCTRDRPHLLAGCLRALRPLHEEGHQVIIVDNAPTSDQTARLVEQTPYRYLLEPSPGLNRARSRGLEAAAHRLVAFTDDDCSPDPAWARQLAAAQSASSAAAVTGLVLPAELAHPAQERFEAYCANRRIFRARRFACGRSFSRSGAAPSTAGAIGMGANMCFERQALQQLGGFDPRFDGGTPTLSGGDTEIFARLLAAGRTLHYTPLALVWHRHPTSQAALRRVIYGYGAGLFAFFAKRLLEDRDPGVLLTAPRWLAGPPAKALWNRLRGRPAAPLDLLWMEFTGSLSGPRRFLQARRAGSTHTAPGPDIKRDGYEHENLNV